MPGGIRTWHRGSTNAQWGTTRGAATKPLQGTDRKGVTARATGRCPQAGRCVPTGAPWAGHGTDKPGAPVNADPDRQHRFPPSDATGTNVMGGKMPPGLIERSHPTRWPGNGPQTAPGRRPCVDDQLPGRPPDRPTSPPEVPFGQKAGILIAVVFCFTRLQTNSSGPFCPPGVQAKGIPQIITGVRGAGR